MENPTAEALEQLRKKGEHDSPIEDFTKPQAVFSIDVTDSVSGKRYAGAFRSKAPTIADRNLIGLVVAQQAGGAPWESIPGHVRRRLEVLATFEVLLLQRPKEGWFNNPSGFYSEDVLEAVYGKIMKHWECFFDPARIRAEARERMTSTEGRLLRWRAERYKQAVFGGADPSIRDLVLELEEVRIWEHEDDRDEDEQCSQEDDPDRELWESAARAEKRYVAKKTGDPLVDQWERDLQNGDDPDLDMR